MNELARRPQAELQYQDFIKALQKAPVKPARRRGRLMFALDATDSRSDAWDTACRIQGKMFRATDTLGGLDVQLVFYRGFDECRKSKWTKSSRELLRLMDKVTCAAGETQLHRVLEHAIAETQKNRVHAMVLIVDCCEENLDQLAARAGKLGLLGMPIFVFQERSGNCGRSHGDESGHARVTTIFKEIAKLSRGAWAPFDASSPTTLRKLLRAVAIFATAGYKALQSHAKKEGEDILLLTRQMAGSP